jgi:hypothetical protein
MPSVSLPGGELNDETGNRPPGEHRDPEEAGKIFIRFQLYGTMGACGTVMGFMWLIGLFMEPKS